MYQQKFVLKPNLVQKFCLGLAAAVVDVVDIVAVVDVGVEVVVAAAAAVISQKFFSLSKLFFVKLARATKTAPGHKRKKPFDARGLEKVS